MLTFKKFFPSFFVLFLSFSLITGCATADNATEDVTLTVGLLPNLDSIPILIALDQGYFDETGFNIEIENFNSAVDRDTALQTNQLDGTATDMLSVVFFEDQGFDVSITSKTEGLFRIVANGTKGINYPQDINGHEIGISSNTIIEYITDIFTQTYNLELNKIAIPQMPTRLEMLNAGNLDLATLPDPLATNALAAGHIELATSETLGVNPAVMLFSEQAIQEKGDAIIAFYEAYNKAVDYLNDTPITEIEDRIIELCDFPEETKGALILPKYTYASLPEEEEWEKVIQWMQEKELTTSNYDFSEVTNASFIPSK